MGIFNATPMDKKAVNILLKTYWSSAGWKTEKNVSTPDFEYAKNKGVMFDPILINHAETIQWLLHSFNNTSKDHIVRCFLRSLSTRRLDLRSGLSSFAFSRNFPLHDLRSENYGFCKICGLYNHHQQEQDLNILNFERIKWGGVRLTDPIYAAWNLDILNRESPQEPTSHDIDIFNQIISVINECESSDLPTHLDKKLAPVIKSSSAERRVIIDIFGICGILETQDHKGFFDNYIPITKRINRPVNKTDWEYPVDWWTGKDGVNKKALNFYFKDYLHNQQNYFS